MYLSEHNEVYCELCFVNLLNGLYLRKNGRTYGRQGLASTTGLRPTSGEKRFNGFWSEVASYEDKGCEGEQTAAGRVLKD